MQTITAKDAKNGFCRLIGLDRAEPVVVEMAVEAFGRLKALAEPWRGAGAHRLWHDTRNGPK